MKMVFELKLVARYAETDQMGIIHHAVYPVWYEAARGGMMAQAGMTYRSIEEDGYMIPLHDLSCRYIKPAHYEDNIRIETRVIEATPVKLVFQYKVYIEGEDTPINIGSTTHAWVRSDTFQLINIKKEYPKLYELLKSIEEKED